ncbi:pullulanase-type alpha-1,6-glucosidase [Catenuloplanes atrovinosus]|uniref:1,4-alpha-D-glucan glucanohydrolase n=1 Tax=Catenuloplanes atrovinosus TaxID=137266 RepID=A0AAE3YRN1_9ACTN|nr:pullulanase-type alpha-1,6-glucosidase [Catenuloplanes atrovinosus]MDR7277957.1 pullulanase-type alpha-1,6-glucosidase [Catenuloplanes atrovinosus]
MDSVALPYRLMIVKKLVAAVAVTVALPLGAVVASPGPAAQPLRTETGGVAWSAEPSDGALAVQGAAARDREREAEQFYFVLPDRFANGDPRNDRGGLPGDRLSTGHDPADKGFYHGGDVRGVIEKLDYIQGLGTTAIWLAPVFKNQPVQGSGADVSAGYHGYWITDFTRLDPHFGSNEDLRRLVDAAHRRGIKIYLDIITNHTADVIAYAENQYGYVPKTASPYVDAAGNAFEDRNHADGTRPFPRVTKDAGPYTPVFRKPSDATVKVPRWLNDPAMYHNRGDSTFTGENSEYGDFFGLDDLWTERPEVVDGMTDIYADWIRELGVDGYRMDTVKHVNMDFWPRFSQGIARAGGDDFFMFGEVYSADPEITSGYVRRGGLPATLDFPFQAAAQGFVTGTGTARGLADVYAADDLYTSRDTDAGRLPTFLGNHDMGRIGSFIAASGGSDQERLRKAQLAHELMFLTRGQPVIYSGDEQGFTGPGGDKDARQDMFASRTADYLDDDLIGTARTHATDNYDTRHPIYRTIAALGALRERYPALADGTQTTRHAAGGPGVFAASRLLADERVEHLIAVNNAATAQTVTIDTFSPSTRFSPIYGGGAAVTSGADRRVTVTVPAMSAIALRAAARVPAPPDRPGLRLSATDDGVEATVLGGDPAATVTVAARRPGGRWELLGTATRAPYRVRHDPQGLPAGASIDYKAVVRDSKGRTASATATATVETPPQAASRDWLVVHYQRPAGDYDGWNLYPWGDIDPAWATTWPAGQPFAGEDSYGRFAWVKLKPGARSVGFLVVDPSGTKDPAVDRTVDVTATGEVWVRQGDPTLYPTRQAATGEPDPVPDQGTAIIHYRRPAGDYDGWGLHVWDGAATPTTWDAPLMPVRQDAYGAVFEVPLAPGAAGLNYIVHRGDVKDLPEDQRLEFASAGREVWLQAGVAGRLLPAGTSTLSPDVDLGTAEAQWLDRSTVAWARLATPTSGEGRPADGKAYALAWSPSGGIGVANGELTGDHSVVPLTARRNGLTDAQRQRFPHLWAYGALEVPASARVTDILRGQVVVTERDHTGRLLAATAVQLPGVLDDVYPDAVRARLGPVFAPDGTPSVSVWAPTARTVRLQLFDTPSAAPSIVDMRRDDRTGVWSAGLDRSAAGRFYRFEVTAWQPAAREVVTASVTDPYSVALAADSTHSQLVDLDDPALAPPGWDALAAAKPAAVPASRIQIQELSVRDFSIADGTVPEAERGTYLAFASRASAGATHLRELAAAGVTHVHLLPSFDFATTPERRADQARPACDLASLPPDSDRQQACVAEVADTDGYNWGYDPLHYTVPEGGYAVNPDGAARTAEFRSMVSALNRDGLRVVLDVVYNHTAAHGVHPHSVLDQIVPGYYHRLLADGTVANSTCCSNTAPEHAMMGKLVVDSMVTWARQYKVDGFRFDLMGHHPKANIMAVRSALDALTVERDGVDGKGIYLYGEGWNFGEVAGDARFVQATQANMAGTGVGTFNDRLRDAVRGGGPFDANPRVQGFASGLFTDPNGDPVNGSAADQRAALLLRQDQIKVGLSGNLASYRFVASSTGVSQAGAEIPYNGSPTGYTAAPGEAITYVDAHDNEILYDALAFKLPRSTPAVDRARMQTLGLATVVLGQGVGFVTAGSERLRSKSLDRNSFNSGDWFNEISWDCAAGNGFGRGLPPAPDNADKWDYARPLLADPALVPGCDAINLADARYRELLEIRRSSPLFSLGTAAAVQEHLSFPLSGPAETPGVITMLLSGPDPRWRSITVVFNATPTTATQTVPSLTGAAVSLHPVLRTSADETLRTASFDATTGTFTVPPRTVAVFVQS